MKTNILKYLFSTVLLIPLAPTAVLAASETVNADSVLAAEHLNAASTCSAVAAQSIEDSSDSEDCEPAMMPFAPLCHGEAGVIWAVSEDGILYFQAGKLNKTDFHQLFDVQSIREIRVVPTESCSKLILPENCSYLFQGFRNVTEMDTDRFDTSHVTSMNSMFADCSSLKKLPLASFNTARVLDMASMFRNCSSLERLDLSSFYTSNVRDVSRMFQDCSSLCYLNLYNFDLLAVRAIT
ncbi:MAG: BspA family leucine-rich repeat surface protein, partial [Erysipelotrichaceae bacterium]|nr:BspA family leucine-rich repeat surface protein [Erysipelotrichaceae bacterium]